MEYPLNCIRSLNVRNKFTYVLNDHKCTTSESLNILVEYVIDLCLNSDDPQKNLSEFIEILLDVEETQILDNIDKD